MSRHAIALPKSAPVDPTLAIEVDLQLLASAVMNLLHNAFKHAPGGAVALRAHAVDQRLVVEVEDECGGIPESKGDLFQAFGERRGMIALGSGSVFPGAAGRASAWRDDLTETLERQVVTICGIGEVLDLGAHKDGGNHGEALVEQLLQGATRDGADLALVFPTSPQTCPRLVGFEVVPTTEFDVTVTESPRHGAPMTLVRGGEDRDLPAIAAMGHVRAEEYRFHLNRNVDLVKHAITRKRLLAGLTSAGARQLVFVIAEEGITAAAYVVISIVGGTWTIEECGDRDASGARVGALLQALIAREPGELRPVIRGWLPPGFLPPQVTITPASSASPLLLARALSSRSGIAFVGN